MSGCYRKWHEQFSGHLSLAFGSIHLTPPIYRHTVHTSPATITISNNRNECFFGLIPMFINDHPLAPAVHSILIRSGSLVPSLRLIVGYFSALELNLKPSNKLHLTTMRALSTNRNIAILRLQISRRYTITTNKRFIGVSHGGSGDQRTIQGEALAFINP